MSRFDDYVLIPGTQSGWGAGNSHDGPGNALAWAYGAIP
jgi:hypothetical protein